MPAAGPLPARIPTHRGHAAAQKHRGDRQVGEARQRQLAGHQQQQCEDQHDDRSDPAGPNGCVASSPVAGTETWRSTVRSCSKPRRLSRRECPQRTPRLTITLRTRHSLPFRVVLPSGAAPHSIYPRSGLEKHSPAVGSCSRFCSVSSGSRARAGAGVRARNERSLPELVRGQLHGDTPDVPETADDELAQDQAEEERDERRKPGRPA